MLCIFVKNLYSMKKLIFVLFIICFYVSSFSQENIFILKSGTFKTESYFDLNTVFLSTGTTFIFGKYLKKIQSIEEKSKFYYLLATNFKGAFLSKRFQGGLIYDRHRKINKKLADNYLALKTVEELKNYKKFIPNKNIKLIIDGYFAQNKKFVLKIKEYNNNITIFCAKNKFTPSLGMASLFTNKKNLLIENFYDIY